MVGDETVAAAACAQAVVELRASARVTDAALAAVAAGGAAQRDVAQSPWAEGTARGIQA